ncbi:FtsX-like permease family protein [Bifidobacterium breve]|nr:FtsX-like permease family protein [Bifidobacterium breve]MCZ4420703.1 FtsX-like permease family protein [Bifidobacterium breve]MCZ4425329.1 FtsX-like permease family protein [Bifidobacterium breve]
MTNTGMFFRMLFSAVFRRRSRAMMAVLASLVGAATLFCLAMICIAVPQQMNEEMRAYGANLIVTPTESTGDKAGIDESMVQHTTEMVKAKGSAKYATYRYENVRVNASPYVMAGVDAAQVKNLNHHWVVDGKWPSSGKVLVGRDIADAIGLKVGSAITIGYRASDNASSTGTSASSNEGTGSANDETSSSSSQNSSNDMQGMDMSGDMAGMDMSGDMAGMDMSGDMAGMDMSGSSSSDQSSSSQTSNGQSGQSPSDQPTQDGRVSSDIMDTSGTEFRVAGIVDTGGSEDSIIYATNADVNKLTGVTRGVDVIEYSAGTSDLAGLVSSINEMTSMHVKAQQVTKITASDTRIITMLQTLFWVVSLVVLVLTLVGVGTTISSIVSQRRNEIGLRKALGASSRAIGIEFYVESVFYGLIGGLIGTAIGYGLASWLCVAVFERSIGFNWWLALISVVFSALVAVVASIPPVHRATRIDPAVVLREE